MATTRSTQRQLAAALRPLGVALAGLMLGASVQAQTVACEMLKASLASRVPADVKDFTLEAIPMADPVPEGGKQIGTCQTNTYKVIIRRHGTQAAAAAFAAAGSGVVAAKAAPGTPAPGPAVVPPAPVTAAPAQAPASAAVPAKPPVAAQPATSPPPPPPPQKTAPVAAAPASQPAAEERTKAETPAPAPARSKKSESTTSATMAPMAAKPAEPAASGPGFFTRNWKWVAGGLAVLLAALVWAWVTHRRDYDEAGLPRGPKLTVS